MPNLTPQIITLTLLIFFVVGVLCYQVAKYTEAKMRQAYEKERLSLESQFKSYRDKYYDLERSWSKINNRAEIRLERARASERRAEKFRSLYEQCCKEKESLLDIIQNLSEEHKDEVREEILWSNIAGCDDDGSCIPRNVIESMKKE